MPSHPNRLFEKPGSLFPWERGKAFSSDIAGEVIFFGAAGNAFGRTHSHHSRPRIARTADSVEVGAAQPMLEALFQYRQQAATDLQETVLSGVNSSLKLRQTHETTDSNLLVEDQGRRDSLAADEFPGQQQMVTRNPAAEFRKVPGIAGATVPGDGRVASIPDINGISTLSSKTPLPAGAIAHTSEFTTA